MSFSISPLTKKSYKAFFCIATFNFFFCYGQFPLKKKFRRNLNEAVSLVDHYSFTFSNDLSFNLYRNREGQFDTSRRVFSLLSFFSLRVISFKLMYFTFILKIPRKFHENFG